jgi:branched-subunit amino acid ABC-type transport system permease component
MNVFLQAVGFGLASGAVVSLGAVGLTVQAGVSNVFNVTYGALMTLAAFLAYLMVTHGVNVWVALLVTAPVIGILSVALNRGLITPLKRRGAGFIGVIIATVYLGLIVQYSIVSIAGPAVVTYGRQSGTALTIGPMSFSGAQVVIIAATVVLMTAFHLVLTRTTYGRALRATSSNDALARACGIRTQRIVDIAWFFTGAMCAATGVALAITTVSFDFSLGATFFIYVLAAAVLGGVGQPYGAMAAGLFVGVASQLAAAYGNPLYQDVAAFGLLVIVLLLRPSGLFTRRGALSGMWQG